MCFERDASPPLVVLIVASVGGLAMLLVTLYQLTQKE